jgi:predicted AAA+ superfamily ATPase
MSGIPESLAGRAAILDMLGLSYKETIETAFSGGPFLPSMDLIRRPPPHKPLTGPEVFKIIWDGSFPKLFAPKGTDRKCFSVPMYKPTLPGM